MSELEHTRVNIRVLKTLGGVVLLAALEEPEDGEAELSVLGAEIRLCDVTDRSDGDGLIGELVIVEREQALGTETHTIRERSVAGGIFPVKPLPSGPPCTLCSLP